MKASQPTTGTTRETIGGPHVLTNRQTLYRLSRLREMGSDLEVAVCAAGIRDDSDDADT